MRSLRWLLPLLLAVCLGQPVAASIVIESATREINLVTQVTSVSYKLTFANEGKEAVDTVHVCCPASQRPNATFVEFAQGSISADTSPLQLEPSGTGREAGAICFAVHLRDPIAVGSSTEVQGAMTFTGLQTPYPAAIFQNEPQRVLFFDNLYILSPYPVRSQTTTVKLPGKEVESYTKEQPTSLKGSSITYGPYTGTAPFSWAELRLHFENNSPFTVASRLVKEYEISHWGNVYVEEKYVVEHQGAKLRGEWSRLEMMRNPQFGQAAVRGFVAALPPRAHSIYFKDAIGNISTSVVKRGMQSTELVLTPRYPLFGGWQAEFTLGYSIPLSDAVVKDPDTGALKLLFVFGSPLVGLPVQQIENRIVLPEGSSVAGVEGAFNVGESSLERKFTYLDTSGRPVVVLRRRNLAFEQNSHFAVAYHFSTISLLREPLLLIAVFIVGFAIIIAYNRSNFAITPDASKEGQRARQASALLQQISDVIAEREKQAGSVGSTKDTAGLLERLKESDEKLKAKCTELERLGAAGKGANLKALLEKERAVQAKIAQLKA